MSQTTRLTITKLWYKLIAPHIFDWHLMGTKREKGTVTDYEPYVHVDLAPSCGLTQIYTRGSRCMACIQQLGFEAHQLSSNATDVGKSLCCEEEIIANESQNHSRESVQYKPCHYMAATTANQHGQMIDNSSVLLQKIAHLTTNADLSDITIIVGDQTYYAHKLVLCCSSEVFKIMLMSESWADHGKRTIVLQEEEECMAVFEDFFRYLYTSVILLTQEKVLAVLMLADKYNVIDLQDLCVSYMQSHLVSTVAHNQVIPWYQYALLSHHSHLAQDCERFMMWNFHKVSSTSHFSDLDIALFERFLASSEMVIPDEYTLFQLLGRWMRHSFEEVLEMDIPMEELDLPVRLETDDAIRLLGLIRFPMMPLEHLIQLQQDPLAMLYEKFFVEQIELAMKLHYSEIEDRNQHLAEDKKYLIQPRSYTNGTWCTKLVIENISSLAKHNVQPLVFSTPRSGSENDENKSWDWHLDLYPKGVEFGKAVMINIFRRFELEGATKETVRAVLRCNGPRNERHVRVCVLVTGVQDCVEYVRKVITYNMSFDEKNIACNIDDLVPFSALNDVTASNKSPYMSGSHRDAFKIAIIVKPL